MSTEIATDWSLEVPTVMPSATDASTAEETSVGLYPVNDMERAQRFAAHIQDTLRYVHGWKTWFHWEGTRWVKDEGANAVFGKAQEMPKILLTEASEIESLDTCRKAVNAALRAGDKAKLEAMIELAKRMDGIATKAEAFDRDAFLLGVRNGVVDLRTGKFRESVRENFITKQAGTVYKAEAKCPLWEKFLYRVLDGDEELIGFIRRAVGYSLTGNISEQTLFFLYGTGRNGKSTFTETLQQLFADYGQRAPAALFTVDRHGNSPEKEIARLVGTRFVIGSEVEEGAKLAESRVKDLTGQDTLVGRFLYSEPFEFRPTHKLWIFGNHKPEIKGSDTGIWRRINLVPFQVQIPIEEVDRDLPDKLLKELPGILNWAIQGCMEWQKRGLGVPKVVSDATAEYKDEEDVLGEFIETHCILDKHTRVERAVLYMAYEGWAKACGITYRLTQSQLAKRLGARAGISTAKSNGRRLWVGISLRESLPPIERTPQGPSLHFDRAGQGRN